MLPIFEAEEKKYEGKCSFLKVEVGEVPDVSEACGASGSTCKVTAVPMFVFFKDGKKLDKTVVGRVSEYEFAKEVKEACGF